MGAVEALASKMREVEEVVGGWGGEDNGVRHYTKVIQIIL